MLDLKTGHIRNGPDRLFRVSLDVPQALFTKVFL